jgi:hypothetical protein
MTEDLGNDSTERSDGEDEDFSNFETCKFRSVGTRTKKSCCGYRGQTGYSCHLKKIFPLNPVNDCQGCKQFMAEVDED